jgi:hypothetical protein
MRLFAAIAFVGVLLTQPALAVDFASKITTLDGKPITDEKGVDINATLGSVSELALLTVYQDETNDVMQGRIKADEFTKEKLRRYALARKIRAGGDVKLKPEEIILLKSLIGKAYPPLIMGQAIGLLEPETP